MYNLSQIAHVLGCPLRGGRQASAGSQPQISFLLTDSRSLTFAGQTLFFALVTAKGDGHLYIPQLYEQGVRAFVVSQSPDTFRATTPEAWFFVVPDTLAALQHLAAFHRSQFPALPVVGITGSNGKTIVKEWLYQLLTPERRVVRTPRSYNSQIGVPLSVWNLKSDCDIALFEAGISQPGEMERLAPIIRPTIGILTNIGAAHDAGFTSRRQKLAEKLRLFASCDVVIYNADLEGINEALEMAGVSARSLCWTHGHGDAQIEVLHISRTDSTTSVRYAFLGITGEFTLPFTDDASLENALHCLALLLYLATPPEEIARKMARLTPLAMRLEVMEGQHGCSIINDVYSNDLTSLEMALEFQRRRATPALSNTLILSDDIQCPEQEEDQRALQIAQRCQIYHIARLVLVGPRATARLAAMKRYLTQYAPKVEAQFFPSTEGLLRSGLLHTFSHQLILLKGARTFQFERIADVLQLRQHETILSIDLDAVVHNLNQYRAHLLPSTRLTCMVKAFGYGTGSFELAKTLQDQNVDFLAVAVADEGVDLRRQGIRTPILVMNPEMSTLRTLIQYRLEPEIYSFRLLTAFLNEANRMGVTRFPIHIKIDTGMHRLGFMEGDIAPLIEILKAQETLVVRSIFSHFATADDPAQTDFVHEQKRRYDAMADALRAALPYPILRHICNSAGIEVYPQYQMEMCRLGIGLYGFEAAPVDMHLHNVATLLTTILQIKEIAPTETVGYMRSGRLSRPSRIAMVPIGYADGFDRRLGNGHATMYVQPRSPQSTAMMCPTLGNVCMDVTFLDVTDCPEAREGDTVEVFGPHLSLRTLSDTLGTIPYEILSTVSTRVKRVYYKE